MRKSEDKGRVPEPDRVQQPLGENPSDDAVREYFVATLENMGADGVVIKAARDALHEVSAAKGAAAGERAATTPDGMGRSGS